jgi:hypothetical protein
MYVANLMQSWAQLVKSLAVIALILTAFGIMLRFIKPAVALSRVAAILGIVIMLIIIPCALARLWSDIPLWQWTCLAAIGFVIWQWRRTRRQPRKRE